MTLTAEEDFGGFVAARWPDLESVALVATLDARTAREVTTRAFADVRGGWDEAVSTGAPTAAARRRLLTRLVGHDAPAQDPVGRARAVEDPDDDGMTRALLEVLAHEEPAVRAVLGAEALWGVTADELGGLLGRAADTLVPAGRTAWARLLSAHRGVLAADGLGARDDRLADDLASALERLVECLPDPPDPAALVAERSRGVRRRNVLVGGGALVAAGAAAWWTLGGVLDGGPGPAAGAGVGAPAGAVPAGGAAADPTAAAWRRAVTWPGRGVLASDYGIQALVAREGPAARLVYADDVEDVRVVVAVTGTDRGSGVRPLLWAGSVGAPGEQLVAVPLAGVQHPDAADVVAVGVPHPTRAVLLVLARPTVSGVDFSPVVHPTPAGSAERTYQVARLENGVGSLLLESRFGLGARVRVDGRALAVPPPVAWGTDAAYDGAPLLGALTRYVASVVGVPPGRVRARAVVDAATSGGVLDPDARPSRDGGRVLLVAAATPDGAVVRALEVTDAGGPSPTTLRVPPTVVPARDARSPALLRLVGTPPDTGRFLVVVPDGGAAVRMLATTDRSYPAGPVSNVVPMRGGTAVVPVVGADLAAAFRLVVTDADGRTTYDAVPPAGRDLLDPEHGLGWLGLPPDAPA